MMKPEPLVIPKNFKRDRYQSLNVLTDEPVVLGLESRFVTNSDISPLLRPHSDN